jgi:hypothetical protein
MMERKFIHHRTETVILNNADIWDDNNDYLFTHRMEDASKYTCIHNLSVQIELDRSDLQFDSIIKNISVDFMIDGVNVLSFNNQKLYSVLVLNPVIFKEMRATYLKCHIINIPIQAILMEDNTLDISDICVSIKFNGSKKLSANIKDATLSYIGIALDNSQTDMYTRTTWETPIKSYYFYPSIQNDQSLDFEASIFKVLVEPHYGYAEIECLEDTTKSVNIGATQLVRTDSMFNRVNQYVEPIDNAYYYCSRSVPGTYDNMYQIAGLCHSHPGHTKIELLRKYGLYDKNALTDGTMRYDICIMLSNTMLLDVHSKRTGRSSKFNVSPTN